MTIQQTLKNWERLNLITERNSLMSHLAQDRDGLEIVVITSQAGTTLRRCTTLAGALNWLDGYETGKALAEAQAREHITG